MMPIHVRLIGIGLIFVTLLGLSIAWFDSQKMLAYERGKRDCQNAAAAKIEQWRQVYEAQRMAAMLDHDQRSTAYQQAAAPIKERIVSEAEARTDRNCLSADAEWLLEEQRQAVNIRFTAPADNAVPPDPG